LRVRRANAADVPAILNLEREAASAAHWARQHYDRLFLSTPSSPSERLVWVAEVDRSLQADEKKTQPEILGFLTAHRMNDECELENLVVHVSAQRKGVGTHLLGELLRCARESRVSPIFLEVRESNFAARGLYEKNGFEVAGLRKGYYSNPPENAVLYRLNLC
jgi:[ribosomal protein S18]-alanine N-acetyltransferase